MIIYENDLLILNLNEKDVLIIYIKENNCDNAYVKESINHMIEGIKNTYSSYHKLNNELGLLFDARNLNQILPIASIWKIAQFFSGYKNVTEDILVGTSILTGSDTIISLVNAFSKLYQNVKPTKFTKDEDEAYEFIYDLFNKENKEENIINGDITKQEIDNLVNSYTEEE